ncbi:MAG TPA: sigma-70 family RNA polymerase sigma factor [Pyrinomonadaceae bacterium]|jgi:RNA polymerase sigma-70 factor (ECF subfamily)
MLPTGEPTDDALVAATRAGDADAFAQLFERHRRRVARIASRFFARPEQIEEIVQESFTKAYFALADFAGAHAASFAAWLAQIAVNVCYDELRRHARRAEQGLEDLSAGEARALHERLHAAAPGADVENALVARDLAAKLLARLSAEDRLVLTLLDAEGLSVAEIARLTGWSVPKVKVRAHRARAHLRGLLRKYL